MLRRDGGRYGQVALKVRLLWILRMLLSMPYLRKVVDYLLWLELWIFVATRGWDLLASSFPCDCSFCTLLQDKLCIHAAVFVLRDGARVGGGDGINSSVVLVVVLVMVFELIDLRPCSVAAC